MLNGKKPKIEGSLKTAFESGYSNAASSLSKMLSDKVDYKNFHLGFHKLDTGELSSEISAHRNGTSLLITTEIFGDLSGKSYLLISEKEFDLLTHGIPESKNPSINLKEEFAKELDNILSASVITRLSNELNHKMYGDIPILIGKVSNIGGIIYDDFSEATEEVYVNSIHFLFENHPSVNPLFIWVMDCNALQVLEPKAVI